MTMHISFAFGVGDYFKFSFSVGKAPAEPTCTKVHETSNNRPNEEKSATKLPVPDRYVELHDRDDQVRTTNHDGLKGSSSLGASLGLEDLKSSHSDLLKEISLNTERLKHSVRPKLTNIRLPKIPSFPATPDRSTPETTKPKDLAVTDCPLFTTLPVEVRDMIYRLLLVSSEPIVRAHELIGYKTIVAGNHRPIAGLDSRIMQTCQIIYHETLPILYGSNKFEFHNPNAISVFASGGLAKGAYDLAAPNSKSRLRLLKTVYIRFTGSGMWSFSHPLLPPLGGNPGPPQPDRDQVWSEWSRTLFADNTTINRGHSSFLFDTTPMAFPEMEKLTLDLMEWQLSANEAILVGPILRTLKEFPKLKWLVVKGISHQLTLDKLREGFNRRGSVFQVDN